MFESITAFFISIILALMSFCTPAPPKAENLEDIQALADIFREYDLCETVYVLNSSSFSSEEEKMTAIFLQGLVAKKSPQIFITSSSLDNTYLEAIEDRGSVISYTDENGESWTLEGLLKKFSSYITDSGYLLYSLTSSDEGLNIAANYATLEGWLPVTKALEDMAINAGLTKKTDISEDEYNVYYQWKFFEKNKKHFTKTAVVHQSRNATGLRDLAIQQGFYTFFTDENSTDELLFRKRVLSYFGDNTHVLGWTNNEVPFVTGLSEEGNMISPSDHSHNNSILASITCEMPVQKAVKNTYTDGTKHYAALVMSDGDNMQWIQNGYAEYFGKLALKQQFPVTWSFPPMLQDFSPVTAKTVYENAGEKDYFMSGVSGAGYMHPTEYPKKALTGFTDKTAAAMAASNMEYVQILDKTPEDIFDEFRLTNSLKYYTRYDNIKGGIISLDPDRYAGGGGKIYFVDDKPFMTYRMSLWHPSNNMSEVTKEWLKEQADIVNSYPADINSIDGYSVINIHPWTISTESLRYFVSCLNENIVLVTVEEMMEMISTNLPHENAEPTV